MLIASSFSSFPAADDMKNTFPHKWDGVNVGSCNCSPNLYWKTWSLMRHLCPLLITRVNSSALSLVLHSRWCHTMRTMAARRAKLWRTALQCLLVCAAICTETDYKDSPCVRLFVSFPPDSAASSMKPCRRWPLTSGERLDKAGRHSSSMDNTNLRNKMTKNI